MRIGKHCPRFTKYQLLYGTSVGLRTALCSFYATIVAFCRHAVVVFQRSGRSSGGIELSTSDSDDSGMQISCILRKAFSTYLRRTLAHLKVRLTAKAKTSRKRSDLPLSKLPIKINSCRNASSRDQPGSASLSCDLWHPHYA